MRSFAAVLFFVIASTSTAATWTGERGTTIDLDRSLTINGQTFNGDGAWSLRHGAQPVPTIDIDGNEFSNFALTIPIRDSEQRFTESSTFSHFITLTAEVDPDNHAGEFGVPFVFQVSEISSQRRKSVFPPSANNPAPEDFFDSVAVNPIMATLTVEDIGPTRKRIDLSPLVWSGLNHDIGDGFVIDELALDFGPIQVVQTPEPTTLVLGVISLAGAASLRQR